MGRSDDFTRPHMRRADLRRQREALSRQAAESPAPAAVVAPAPQAVPGGAAATILTVCTGNICRSPMAEVLLASALQDLGVRVHSGGTHALVNHGMTEQAQQLAIANGADEGRAAEHRARLLIAPMLDESDFVLAMAREHRSHVVQMSPALLRRSFTVREFARLAETLSDEDIRQGVSSAGASQPARLRALATLVAGQRGFAPAAPGDDDVVDPYRRSQATYDRSAAQLVPAVAATVRAARLALDA